MDTSMLKQWAIDHNIVNETIECFWECFKNWEQEECDEYHDLFLGKIEDAFISVEEHSLQLVHMFNYTDFVYCRVNIYFMEKYIGNYELCFNLAGEVSDDFLNFDHENIIKTLMAESKVAMKIIKKALEEGLDCNLISRITSFDLKYVEIINKKILKANR